MAILYSEDASAKDRGDLGYFKRGELLPVFEKEALRLKVGEVSGIVRTEFGFHIIKLLDRKGGTPLPFEEVKEKVQADYYEYQMDKAFKQFISSLREKSVIEIRLVTGRSIAPCRHERCLSLQHRGLSSAEMSFCATRSSPESPGALLIQEVTSMHLPIVGITMGDPTGIGPEIIVKALGRGRPLSGLPAHRSR